jgi:hypothetical protein
VSAQRLQWRHRLMAGGAQLVMGHLTGIAADLAPVLELEAGLAIAGFWDYFHCACPSLWVGGQKQKRSRRGLPFPPASL